MRWRNYGHQECKDFLEYVLIPGLAAVLPWRICYCVFRRIAHWEWLYRDICQADLALAQSKGYVQDSSVWLWQRRLVQMVDHADHYLHRTRSDRWWKKHMRVSGAWGENGAPSFLFTFHWGAGMWGLRHAQAEGLRVHALSASIPEHAFVNRRVFGCYVRARLHSVEQALKRPLVYVPKGLRNIKKALANGEQVLALLDVPQDAPGRGDVFSLLGEDICLSASMPEMAAAKKAPYCIYVTGFDFDSGERFLRIASFPPAANGVEIMERAVVFLEALIKEQPAAWHLWGQWLRFRA